jgi:hypothetical protein
MLELMAIYAQHPHDLFQLAWYVQIPKVYLQSYHEAVIGFTYQIT